MPAPQPQPPPPSAAPGWDESLSPIFSAPPSLPGIGALQQAWAQAQTPQAGVDTAGGAPQVPPSAPTAPVSPRQKVATAVPAVMLPAAAPAPLLPGPQSPQAARGMVPRFTNPMPGSVNPLGAGSRAYGGSRGPRGPLPATGLNKGAGIGGLAMGAHRLGLGDGEVNPVWTSAPPMVPTPPAWPRASCTP